MSLSCFVRDFGDGSCRVMFTSSGSPASSPSSPISLPPFSWESWYADVPTSWLLTKVGYGDVDARGVAEAIVASPLAKLRPVSSAELSHDVVAAEFDRDRWRPLRELVSSFV